MDSSAANILREFASQPSPDSSDSNPTPDDRGIRSYSNLKKDKSLNYPLNPHVRLHPTELPRYLHNLMKNSETHNGPSMSVTAFEGEDKEEGAAAAPSDFNLDNMAACGEVGANESIPSGQQPNPPSGNEMFCGEAKGFCQVLTEEGKKAGGSLPSLPPVQSHRDSLASSGTKSDSSSKEEKAKTSTSRNKKKRPPSSAGSDTKGAGDNFKNVDVLYENTLIARFLTQTECAAYLRATPEAVSYHCSKGGGVCNGLNIRPCQSTGEALTYGLFEGAEKYRPKERPQLNKESVKILKDWLLSPEHVENPYPNQLEMSELVQKTGLDKMQLKHWFNNARKRILKPYLKDTSDPSGDGSKGKKKKRRIRKEVDGDAVKALAAAATKTNATPSSEGVARNPFDDDGPALTESDERPRSGSQSLFGNGGGMGGMNNNLEALRNGNSFGNCNFGGDSMFGPSGMMGFNNDRGGGMMGSLSSNPFGFQFNGLNRLNNNGASFSQQMRGDLDGGALFGNEQDDADTGSPETTRSNAVFKQQVAAMAMDEANIAFQDTEAAYSQAKELYARSTFERPEEEDPMVIEANSVAKRCQSVAVFKLKVSQRANEEAAKAYAKYQQQGGSMDLNFDNRGF